MSITRTRGDTQKHEFILSTTKDSVTTILDLSLVSSVEFAFNKAGTVIVKVCDKDADPLTGKCSNGFLDSDVDTVGTYPYDIQVYWLDGTKTTFIVSEIEFLDDVNKG